MMERGISSNTKRKIYSIAASILILCGIGTAYFFQQKHESKFTTITQNTETLRPSNEVSKEAPAKETVAEDKTVTAEAKESIKKEPPKHTPIKKIETVKRDGSQTTIVSDGDIDTEELNRISQVDTSSSSPYDVSFRDETGEYAFLETVLKDYLNSNLRWGSEIKELKEIIIRNAGETGWSGQYSGVYTISAGGDIVSAFGYIVLNTYYYQNSPNVREYLKLVLSHEYGHHYTQYHKWVDYDLPLGERFPLAYYQVRPLSYGNTSADCTVWSSCDSEIIAEDYSYFYSGFGLQAMSNTYGFPSSSAKTWLDNLSNYQAPVQTDNPPTIAITSPVTATVLQGNASFTVEAKDDKGVASVDFYIDEVLLVSDSVFPYEIQFNTSSYENGSHLLKARVWDSSNQKAENIITATFSNELIDSVKPIVTITKPLEKTAVWSSGGLVIEASATDNVAVTKIEIYINNTLAATQESDTIARVWQYFPEGIGEYQITVKAFDEAGNCGESLFTVQKDG